MAVEINLSELKEKFNSAQTISQELRDEKIRTESELQALERDYQEKMKELLEKTGASTYEEAVQMIQSQKQKLESDMQKLNSELSAYLDTYGETS